MIEYSVDELLPHSGKMMLLERVLAFDESSMTAEVIVRDDGLFGSTDAVPAWLGMEYMAQTIAAHCGMLCRLAGKPLLPGLLLGTRRYHCNVDSIAAGTELIVTVNQLVKGQDQGQGLAVFDCQISGDNVLISAQLNVYQTEKAFF